MVMNCQTEKQRRRSNAASKAMKRRAESRKCPKCGRKNAVTRTADNDFVVYTCRWCDYERGGIVGEPSTFVDNLDARK